MKLIDTRKHKGFFEPMLASASVQAAMMVLKPGQSSADEPANAHPQAEQWLYVISGSGRVVVGRDGKRSEALKEGTLLLIEKNEPHQITNTGRTALTTINFYAPPAYTSGGEVKKAAKRQ